MSRTDQIPIKCIGIIDSALDNELLKKKCNRMTVLQDNVIEVDDYIKKRCSHGTLCALILQNYCNLWNFCSLEVLDDAGKGNIKNVKPALEWCITHDVFLVNLSFGSTYYGDKKELRQIVNHYVNKGLIIVAASSNDGYISYPSALSNVIGVATGDIFAVDRKLQSQKGIDFVAPSNHEITIEGVSFQLEKSNSYVAPYLTALVANLLYEKESMTIDEIRNRLCDERNTFIYSPDWIESAWITPDYRKSKAKYYFYDDNRNLQECIDDIDTIVLSNKEGIDKYVDMGKHIVYIGNDSISQFDKKHHFWSRELRCEQIMFSKERTGELDIPIICCKFNNTEDIIWCLSELKELFENAGYNTFSGCSLVDSVLYDLEYLPDEETIQEKLMDFVYWQTYYQQSDLVLIGMVDKDTFVNKPDMVVHFNSDKDGVFVKVVFDGDVGQEKYYMKLDEENITKIYDDIVSCFGKEDE